MNSILICEGSTDFVLLQYFMRGVFEWEDDMMGPGFLRPSRKFKKGNNHLTIGGVGGCSKIIPNLEKIIESNSLSASDTEYYEKIVIVTDRDDVETENNFMQKIEEILLRHQGLMSQEFTGNEWNSGTLKNARNEQMPLNILVLVIPFEETGALETFLLKAIGKQSEYDKNIILKGNDFVDTVDPDKRYLTSRRYITKAKFDVYFSIRTPSAFFVERQNILKGIEWEKYMEIQKCFEKLGEL